MVGFSAKGLGKVSAFGMMSLAWTTYDKGVGFFAASILLNQQSKLLPETRKEAFEYVRLHLLCQGAELILKGLILLKKFDLKRQKEINHDLMRIADVAIEKYSLKPLSPPLAKELAELNCFFKTHRMRYGGAADLFISPYSLPSSRVHLRLRAILKLAERERRLSAVAHSA